MPPQPRQTSIGGGIAFNFDLADLGSQLGEPAAPSGQPRLELGSTGRRASGDALRSPSGDRLLRTWSENRKFERFSTKGRCRKDGNTSVGTLNFSGDVSIVPTVAERFGLDNDAAWPKNILDWAKAPVDLSFLNAPEKPAGKHGFLKTVNDRLVFDDSTPARFWGTNVVAYSLFATISHEDVRRQARRLSALGFNLVRLHHIDSDWVQPNIFGNARVEHAKIGSSELGAAGLVDQMSGGRRHIHLARST